MMQRTFRTLVLSIGLLIFPLAALAQLTPVRVSVIPILDLASFYAALQEGYFKAEGLDVTTQTNHQGGAVGIPGTIAGAYDIAYTNSTTTLLAFQQGLDLRIIAAGGSSTPPNPPEPAGLLARKADNLRAGKEMEGKTIAVNVRGGVQWLFARNWVKATGGDPDKVTYREVPFPQMVDVLKGRQADAVFAIDPFLTIARRDPALDILGWPFHTALPQIQVAHYVVTAETAAKRADMVRKYVRALQKGAEWVNANTGKDPFFKLVNSFTKMDPKLLATMPTMPMNTEIDMNSLRKMATLMREHGLLKTDLDLSQKLFK